MAWRAAVGLTIAIGALAPPLGVLAGQGPAVSPSQPTALPAEITDRATVGDDDATVNAIFNAAQTGGFGAIGARIADLTAIVARAPAPFRRRETIEGVIYVRTLKPEDCLLVLAAVAAEKPPAGGASPGATCLANPYAPAAFLIGSYDNEIGRHEDALKIIDIGTGFDSTYAPLIAEKGDALNQMHRPGEALDVYRGGLAQGETSGSPKYKGILLRGEGFALTELGRYDEAEQAYRESLKVDPNHGHAVSELDYIKRMKAGGPRVPIAQTAAVTDAKSK